MAGPPDPDAMINEFCGMCSTTPDEAARYLSSNNWDMIAACNSYFQDEDEKALESQGGDAADAAEDNYTGPRTLDGRPAPEAASGSSRAAPAQAKKKGVATLGSLGGASSHANNDDDDDDDLYDDDDDDNRGDLFAGGEKSGLAVKDPKRDGGPRKIISDILAKARENARQNPSPDAGPSSRPTRFRGTGVTLGGEGVESRSFPDPSGPARAANVQPQERVLHIWQDGFSVDDGELRRFDDPANQMDLQMIKSGRAPLHLMNVENDQPVDVKLHQHDTPYKPQPKKYKPFGGSGQRLGSIVPGDGNEAPEAPAAPAAPAATTEASSAPSSSAAPTIDNSQPTIMIRIQLPDGTRLPARFNTTHTLGEVYGFVQGASPETRSRPWVLATTFPNKEHTDQDLVLGEMAEFKKGGTAVVKWK